MLRKLIFYGSLMNLDLFTEITGRKPYRVRNGFVKGDLYEVTASGIGFIASKQKRTNITRKVCPLFQT